MENVIYVGRKPIANYILALLHALSNHSKVTVAARGRNISKAVAAVVLTQKRHLPNLKIENVKIGTLYVGKKGISTIEITARL